MNIAIILLLLGWLLLFKKAKWGRRTIGLGLSVLCLFAWGPVPTALIKPLESRFSNVEVAEHIDGIIVLGGGFSFLESGTVQFGALNRVVQGGILAQAFDMLI